LGAGRVGGGGFLLQTLNLRLNGRNRLLMKLGYGASGQTLMQMPANFTERQFYLFN